MDAVSSTEDPVGSARAESPRASGEPDAAGEEGLIEEELLVEEVSIDGMCGVY